MISVLGSRSDNPTFDVNLPETMDEPQEDDNQWMYARNSLNFLF